MSSSLSNKLLFASYSFIFCFRIQALRDVVTIILLIFRVRIPVEGFRRTSGICFSNPWVSPHAPFLHHPTHFVRFPLLFRFEGLNYVPTVLNQETCSVTHGSTRSSPPSSLYLLRPQPNLSSRRGARRHPQQASGPVNNTANVRIAL